MRSDLDLLTSPLFIMKKLQRDAFRAHAAFLRGRVLDIGCGTRPFRKYLSCDEYVGIDESADVAPDLRASVSAIPFKDGYFDAVLCTEVLEHVKDPKGAFAEIGKVLKQGGRLYITAPQSWPLHYEPCDYWRFTPYGLEELIAAVGLKTVSIVRIGGVCSLVGQELMDALAALLKRIFSFFGPSVSEKAAGGVCLPFSIFFYFLGKAVDRLDKRYALGWAVVAVKR